MNRIFAALALPALLLAAMPADAHECDIDHEVKTIDGQTVDLHEYEGKVLLIVNVASKCGYTPQYEGLQALHEKYKDQGLVVLGFPCNQFGGQEPGTEAQIAEFCKANYGVTFPMFGKVDVNGKNADPLFKELTAKTAAPAGDGKVSWNFEKFLINREGNLVGRYKSKTKPTGEELTGEIEKLL